MIDIDYFEVKRNVELFQKKQASMPLFEQMRRANETDRIFNKGVKYWNVKNYDLALQYFQEALDIYPINSDVIGLYGDYYEYTNYDLSMAFYELAISLSSLRKKDYYQLANFYKWKGQYDKAAHCYSLWEKVNSKFNQE